MCFLRFAGFKICHLFGHLVCSPLDLYLPSVKEKLFSQFNLTWVPSLKLTAKAHENRWLEVGRLFYVYIFIYIYSFLLAQNTYVQVVFAVSFRESLPGSPSRKFSSTRRKSTNFMKHRPQRNMGRETLRLSNISFKCKVWRNFAPFSPLLFGDFLGISLTPQKKVSSLPTGRCKVWNFRFELWTNIFVTFDTVKWGGGGRSPVTCLFTKGIGNHLHQFYTFLGGTLCRSRQ